MRTHIDAETSVNEGRKFYSFDVVDNKGRAVGASIRFNVYTFVAAEESNYGYSNIVPGTYFAFTPSSTRGGESFGAAQGFTLCKTEEERHLAVEKYLKNAKARAIKSWSKK